MKRGTFCFFVFFEILYCRILSKFLITFFLFFYEWYKIKDGNDIGNCCDPSCFNRFYYF